MSDYTPTRDFKMGGGDGPLYGRLIVEELKPLIDNNLRTLTNAPNSALGGSSLGGLISLALGFEYPNVFSKLAVMSPSIWWNGRSILHLVDSTDPRPDLRIWLDMGSAEGQRHLRDCDLLHAHLTARGWQDAANLCYERIPGGLHNEDAWADRFGQVLQFLFPAQSIHQ
jgi:predicted alpha/beta superfamily hydrolase